jgi:heat shock protein HslJ
VVAFADGRLTVESQQTGHVGMADLAENAWRLERFSADDVVPEGVEVTFQVTPDGGISGSSGCNAFTGQVTSDPERKSFEVGVLATTRRMCPPDVMAVEDRFLELMGIVASYSWQQGQLMLTYVEPEFNAMYFDATDGPAPNGDAGGA